ncbi:hypothetical protein B0T14DRAFT_194617 [Immersiella caudata]|uniref:Uncharacterized protein n=1 Tax=Immersiella caudata TaxID=314043 RepID=A0AA40C410_9PEZI|nr:hypothetical protein B0T14DRAFT_194617 [Immersiella caudata]
MYPQRAPFLMCRITLLSLHSTNQGARGTPGLGCLSFPRKFDRWVGGLAQWGAKTVFACLLFQLATPGGVPNR